jgi:hypothetical protein
VRWACNELAVGPSEPEVSRELGRRIEQVSEDPLITIEPYRGSVS